MIGKQMLTIADPKLMTVVMKGEEIAGFCLVFPDVAETLKAINGRLWPFGWLRVLIAQRRTTRLLGNGIGLLPEHQGMGASAMMYLHLNDVLRARGAQHLEGVQAMETNFRSVNDATGLGMTWHKRHRVYRLDL
jgi:hypothetical protein